ncbi:MAG TPA: hypothetical protein VK324_08270, partial [Tepidisphaeraceae bacterium]|nr:hypothetical protein [Tepidisphaeraceae bacterium]
MGRTVVGHANQHHARFRRRRRATILAGLAVAYALLMAFGGCADNLILFPSTAPTHAYKARRHAVPFDGGQLEIWVGRSPGAAGREPAAFML